MGVLWAMSLPGLIVLLVILASLEKLGRWAGGRNRLPWRRRTEAPLSAAGIEQLDALLLGGKQVEMEERKSHSMMREEEGDNAPPRSRVDLDAGVARLIVPPREIPVIPEQRREP